MNFFNVKVFPDENHEDMVEIIPSIPDFKKVLLDDTQNKVYFRLGDFTLATSYDNYFSHRMDKWKIKK